MKIMTIGANGSGKSTFSMELSKLLQLPLYHLDAYFWKPGWVQTPNDEWDEFIRELVIQEEWIIDGYYGRTLDIRMQAADVIIFFDLSPWITTYRVIKRRIQYHGKTRPDLNEGCPESIDWEFIKYGWNFRKNKRAGIIDKLNNHADTAQIVILNNPKQVRMVLDGVQRHGVDYFEQHDTP
jgi:adenylate kinase family enzyme